jgi:hypothetical protein
MSDAEKKQFAVQQAVATAPPKLAWQPAPATLSLPPSQTAPAPEFKKTESKKPSRFWEFIVGPSQPSPASNAAKPNASLPAQASVNHSTSPAQAAFGGSLFSQLLGTNSPPPQSAANESLSASIPLSNQFLLASAEEETQAAAAERKPTVRDIEEAKTPAESMTISRPGWTQQLSMPIEAPAESAPNTTGMLSVPTVPTGYLGGIASALWRPLAMTTDAPTAPMPDEAAPPAATASLPESERVPSLLRPFYATNPPPPGSAANSASRAEEVADATQTLTDMFVQSSLGRQMTLATNEDLRTPMTAAIEAQVKHDQQPRDGRVTFQWPLMANPFTMTDTGDPPVVAGSAVAQVAFLQEPLPVPTVDDSTPDDIDLPGDKSDSANDDQSNAAGAGKKNDEPKTLVGAKTIGTAPEDNSLEFLRTQTVLLSPGKSQFDIGIEYTLTENDFPILLTDGAGTVIGVDNVEFKGRELAVPMELRCGLLNRVQGFVQVPVGWANVQAAIDNFDEFDNDGGIGDIGFGLTAQLRDAYKDCPYLIGTIAGLAPTGGDPFGVFGVISPNAPSLGNGFWAISGNLLWVQPRYDPVVLFYGFGARYQFEHQYLGIDFQPGTEFNYTLGTGFAVNERVTLSTQFFGSYIEELKANGERVEGTIQEPMNLRLAATLAKPCNRIVEPFITVGLTDDSISANFGITWTY